MKKLIAILVLVISFQVSKAQNVGINAPIPTATLDINGNLRVRIITDSLTSFILGVDSSGFVYRIPIKFLIKSCGPGFLDVPDSIVTYSIEINRHAATNWLNAADSCRSKGAHLCTWEQWTHACRTIGGSLNNMPDNMSYNFEWTGDNTGSLTVLSVGGINCVGMGSEVPTTTLGFRCCCDK